MFNMFKNNAPARWRFADKYNQKELDTKKSTVAKIDAFWLDFQKDAERLKRDQQVTRGQCVVDFITRRLPKIHESIMWEAGADDENSEKLSIVFTAEGKGEIEPIIETMLEKAPEISGWTFGRSRFPLAADLVECGFKARADHDLIQFDSHCKATETNLVDVIISSPTFSGDNQTPDLADAFILAEIILGERNLDDWIGLIETRKSSDAIVFSSNPTESITKFKIAFQDQKDLVIERLPKEPYHLLPLREETTVMSLENTKAPRVTFLTKFPEVLKAVMKPRFQSNHFSKHGERFGYLRAENAKRFADGNERDILENEIDKALTESKIGKVIGSGFGLPETIFIDIVFFDIDTAIPILRTICDSHKLPENTKLRFYDRDWEYEWVGMFPYSKAPTEPTALWAN